MNNKVVAIPVFFSIFLGLLQSSYADNTSDAMSKLSRIELLYFKYLNAAERKEAVRLMNETRELVVDAGSEQEHAGAGSDRNILSEEAFLALYGKVKDEISDAKKTQLVLFSLGAHGRIYMKQMETLIKLYTFDGDRKKLLIDGHDNIVDPINVSIVAQYFANPFVRDDVLKFYGQK